DQASPDLRFATAVAGFGLLLKNEPLSNFGYDEVVAIAQMARGEDINGERAEFVRLVKTADALVRAQTPPVVGGPE
ncbi:YfbK domain-containing protein, partial [Microbulbifer sp.]|uniref:YfbK domain-containing protein n=1 Tax=Microbulbifer sp. TaxID=1908541 RepID=UPI002F934C52